MDNHQLVKAMLAGDKKAFDQMYQEYHLILYRTAYLILGNSYDAEDVLQETFVTAYTSIGSLKDPSKLKTWLFSILKHAAYKQGKKRNREWPDEYINEKINEYIREEGQEESFLQRDQIQEALRTLPPKQREVIVLYYYNDLSIEEIAQVCKTFQGTVKSRLYKARKELKKELEKTENFESSGFEREGVHARL